MLQKLKIIIQIYEVLIVKVVLKVFTNDIKKPEYILTLNKVLSSFLEFNEEIVKIENTSGGIANKVIKLTTNFDEYNYKDCYNVFEYYVVKQLLEKFSDYEIYGIDLYSEQQQQDDFRNWIYYFEHLDLIKQIFDSNVQKVKYFYV